MKRPSGRLRCCGMLRAMVPLFKGFQGPCLSGSGSLSACFFIGPLRLRSGSADESVIQSKPRWPQSCIPGVCWLQGAEDGRTWGSPRLLPVQAWGCWRLMAKSCLPALLRGPGAVGRCLNRAIPWPTMLEALGHAD